MSWPVVYYRGSDGSEPVNDAIDLLPPRAQAAIDNQIERLELFGPALGFPHTSQLEGELRELRCHYGKDHYRILYRRSRNIFLLLHFMAKRTARLPADDMMIAQERWEDFVCRMNELPRRGPRAAGHDAP